MGSRKMWLLGELLISILILYLVTGRKIEAQIKKGVPEFVTFHSSTLSLKWGANLSTDVKLKPSSQCIFEGSFEDEPDSKVLVTLAMCSNTALDIHIHSKNMGDILASYKNGKLVEEEVVTDNNNDLKRSVVGSDPYDDYITDFDFYDEFYNISELEYEFEDDPLPSAPLTLHVNVYLDVDWLKAHQSYAQETAGQVVKQAAMILQHPSLDIKIELVPHQEMFETLEMEHVEPNQKGVKIFEKFLEGPFEKSGSPVTHVLLTANDDSPFIGIGRLQSVCSSKEKAVVITKWIRNTPRTAITLAHEIGHILGMRHDFKPVPEKRGLCGEGRKKGTLIMNYGEPRTVWSRCSNQDFRRLYDAVIATRGEFCLKERTSTFDVASPPPSGWGEWQPWSQCSKRCGGGRWTRTRLCSGSTCRHSQMSQERFCNIQPC